MYKSRFTEEQMVGMLREADRSYREGVLDMHVFKTQEEVRERTEAWLANTTRSYRTMHSAT